VADAKARAPPVIASRASLRAELLRGSACKTFTHQFSVMAKRQPRAPERQGWWHGAWQPRMWKPAPIEPPKLGLAAAKHAQGLAAHMAQGERYRKASHALASVQSAAQAEWPDAMKRELASCRTADDHRAWSEKWALQLAGRIVSEIAPERPVGGGRNAGGGRQPSE
jgi:hypothetical protein